MDIGYLSHWTWSRCRKLTLAFALTYILVTALFYFRDRCCTTDYPVLPLSSNKTSEVTSFFPSNILLNQIFASIQLKGKTNNTIPTQFLVSTVPKQKIKIHISFNSSTAFTPPVVDQGNLSFLQETITNPHDFSIQIYPNSSCSTRTIELVICVPIGHNNFRGRDVIRKTWGSYAQNKSHNALLVFFIGSSSSYITQINISKESTDYGDIFQEDYIDSYRNLTLKSVSILKWVSTFCSQAQFVVKADDDTFLNVPLLVTALRHQASKKSASETFIIGYLQMRSKPSRNRFSKWYVSTSVYAGGKYPYYMSGTTYAMTGVAACRLFEASLRTPIMPIEDVYITGICAQKASVDLINNYSFHSSKHTASGCFFRTQISDHKYSAQELFKIYRELHDDNLQC